MNLEYLDFSYNSVENQHNLICSRNFRKLRVLDITGNPFAVIKEHKGLEMEVFARTSAKVINDEVEKPYLKLLRKPKPSIKYNNLIPVPEDTCLRNNYFAGIEVKPDDEDDDKENMGDSMNEKPDDFQNY